MCRLNSPLEGIRERLGDFQEKFVDGEVPMDC